jgi:hypothetical protein
MHSSTNCIHIYQEIGDSISLYIVSYLSFIIPKTVKDTYIILNGVLTTLADTVKLLTLMDNRSLGTSGEQ